MGSSYSFVEAEDLVRNNLAKPGDLIEFDRGKYQHWAFYEGDGNVIHVPAESKNAKNVTVRRDRLVDVAKRVPGQTKVRVNNQQREAELMTYRHGEKNCRFDRSVEEQLRDARNMLGQNWDYDFFCHNCEHFATLCKYGDGFSSQSPESDPHRV